MDTPEETEILKRCHKCEHELLGNLSIIYNASSSVIVTWNRFQIFVYEDLNFESTAKIFIPEFQVRQIIIANNYLLCLDTSGNVHTTCMKFKNPAQKRFKSSFQPREQSVLCCTLAGDSVLSLRHESDLYFLCLNKLNSEFSSEKKAALLYNGRWPLPQPIPENCLLISHKLTEQEFDYVKTIFDVKENIMRNDCNLVVVSLDKLTVYGCLFSPKMAEEDVTLVKLYTCPSEICNFEIVQLQELHILIGLNIGTLVRLSLKDVAIKPELVHLNIALHKFQTLKDTIIYTDGNAMWKTDSTFTENISFFQFFVRHVKDFIKFGDQIICTTYSDLIYVFPIDDDSSYIKAETTDEYCSAEKLLNNSEYLHKIIEELEKNNELVKRINEEGNFVTAFSLSNRQDIMDNIIHHSITVYDSYDDAKTENPDIILTDKIFEYFDPDAFHILVKLTTTTLQHMFNNILSNIFNDVKIHISLSTEKKLLKTASVKVTDAFKKINILLPINLTSEDISEMNVNMELISSVPGAFDEKQKLWVTLYRKRVTLNAEHFIKLASTKKNNFRMTETIEDLVYNVALAHFGGVYKFTDMTKYNLVPEFSVYLKLPQNYKAQFKNQPNVIDYMNKKKVAEISKHYTSEEFLKATSNFSFEIGNKKVKVGILSDEFSAPLLKVTCGNMAAAVHIRNFFSMIMYEDFGSYEPAKEFVKYMLYNETEVIIIFLNDLNDIFLQVGVSSITMILPLPIDTCNASGIKCEPNLFPLL